MNTFGLVFLIAVYQAATNAKPLTPNATVPEESTSECHKACSTTDECRGQLRCITSRCLDPPVVATKICQNGPPDENDYIIPPPADLSIRDSDRCFQSCKSGDDCGGTLICILGTCGDSPDSAGPLICPEVEKATTVIASGEGKEGIKTTLSPGEDKITPEITNVGDRQVVTTSLPPSSPEENLSGCHQACTATSDCPGQLSCISGKCLDAPHVKAKICQDGPPGGGNHPGGAVIQGTTPAPLVEDRAIQGTGTLAQSGEENREGSKIIPAPRRTQPEDNPSGCHQACSGDGDCPGQLRCTSGRCLDPPHVAAMICQNGPPGEGNHRSNGGIQRKLGNCFDRCESVDDCRTQLTCIVGRCDDDPHFGSRACENERSAGRTSEIGSISEQGDFQ